MQRPAWQRAAAGNAECAELPLEGQDLKKIQKQGPP